MKNKSVYGCIFPSGGNISDVYFSNFHLLDRSSYVMEVKEERVCEKDMQQGSLAGPELKTLRLQGLP